MRTATFLPLLGIAAAPLLLAALGVTHPQVLIPETAPYWYRLHLILLVLFPLLGVNYPTWQPIGQSTFRAFHQAVDPRVIGFLVVPIFIASLLTALT